MDGKRLSLKGILQEERDIMHLIAKEITDLPGLQADVGNRSNNTLSSGNDLNSEPIAIRSRNFH